MIEISRAGCVDRYFGRIAGVSAHNFLDGCHYISAGAVCFARGLNDTPKIAALLVAAPLFGNHAGPIAVVVGIMIALGGVHSAGRVAETMSNRITSMNSGQGFTANLVTSFLVILASRWGLPVSTTHVSCGALFGIGAATGEARWKVVGGILLAWVTTLPLALAAGALTFRFLTRVI